MPYESLGLDGTPKETSDLSLEGGPFNISDGMEPVDVPPRITKENFAAIFGGKLPDGIDPKLFEGGELELEQ
jgi:hypothetical protein